ncbi:serine hydrolase [Mycobacterium sp.]|uniref:serine hydrolase n=1 Tax=Mycobacterium sp. TaxID=1785 RepID=UPI003C747150
MTPPPSHRALEDGFGEIAGTLPATVGIAVARPGRADVYSLGSWSVGVAWSTAKVPLAVAALRNDHALAKDLVVKAITESDNPASEQLWSQLGKPVDAARRVQAVIREAGDSATIVETQRLRPGYTAFGQTQWTLCGQAQFAANLANVPGSATVVDLMKNLVAEHRWGLARRGVAAKGGWGPELSAGYLVRQFGIVPTESGECGVAIAANAPAFEAGVAALDTLTDWLFDHLPELTRF